MGAPKLDVYEKGCVYSHFTAFMGVFLFSVPYSKTFVSKTFEMLWMGVGPRPRYRRLDVAPSPPSTCPLLPPSDKKTLFVDLDRTLIISRTSPPPIDAYNSAELLVLTFTNRTYYVTKRPGVEQLFRSAIASGFEIVVFTSSSRGYASPILDWLDPMSEFITHRLYHDSCSVDANGRYFKDLDATGRQLDKSVIIEDDPRFYWKHYNNLLWVKPFKGNPQDVDLQKLSCFFEVEQKFQDGSSDDWTGWDDDSKLSRSRSLSKTMASALDMTLDDIIKSNKKKPSSAAAAAGGAGPKRRNRPAGAGGPAGRSFKRSGKRAAAPFSKAPDAAWQHDMFTDNQPAKTARISSIETGTKLYISNLDYGVSNDDIKELFAEIGDLKRFSVNYDKSGRSKGTAEVVYARRNDAMAAVKRYHNVQLDGKPMKIEIIGTNVSKPAPLPRAGGFNSAPRTGGPRRGGPGPTRRGGKPGNKPRGKGGKGGGEPKKVVSAEDLDKELDNYHNESMQIN
ncbi:hypothetical protein LUZ60_012977 [Juncus effusus]|nr:hypothetical protein LUZ60_012977 [Juncus effusus]